MVDREDACGCCEGAKAITPESTANRPGLQALVYRAGTHSTFFEAMKSRLSGGDRPSLRDLKTRAEDDPSVALLDAWAVLGDVLTFYQERIANEGYLRTAQERRSVLELTRLIGYSLRPGVAASVWLALELEKGYEAKIEPYELKAQSLPGPGEVPQTFENIERIDMRHTWNRLQPRLSQPQTIASITEGSDMGPPGPRIYIKGISANLRQNDVLLLTASDQFKGVYRVIGVETDPTKDRTLALLESMTVDAASGQGAATRLAVATVSEEYASDAVTKRYGVSTRSEMALRTIAHLEFLSRELRAPGITNEAADRVVRKALAGIVEEKKTAIDAQYARLGPWLTAMVVDLTAAAQSVVTTAAGDKAAAFARAATSDATVGDLAIGDPLKNTLVGLTKRASVPPCNAASLERDVVRTFDTRADVGVQVAGAFEPNIRQTLPAALANVKVAPDSPVRAYVFRAVARPFGHNAALRPSIAKKYDEKKVSTTGSNVVSYDEWTAAEMKENEASDGQTLYLDAHYDRVQEDSWIVIDTSGVAQSEASGHDFEPAAPLIVGRVANLKTTISRAAYGMSGPSASTQVKDPLCGNFTRWFKSGEAPEIGDESFKLIRQTTVYIQSEELDLADEPIETSISGGDDDPIELDGLYSGLQSGRWLIVAGERDDVKDETGKSVGGITAAELVMLAEVTHKTKQIQRQDSYYSYGYGGSSVLPGDRTHTFIRLARKLEFCYRRDKVTIYGNVVKATHGETRKEILGSGDTGKEFQSFTLKQPPLTYVASARSTGAESSLKVYVNDVQWHEEESHRYSGKNDRIFVAKTGDDAKTTVIFGDGEHGLRLPTGTENVRAVYRNGIGTSGNVKAEQISQLLSKPLGVKGVVNPERASGGADQETRDTARKNAPRTVTALDRLVSVTDYADFACNFAGVGKALAVKITDGRQQLVHITIAGADDTYIDETSELCRNLLQALRDHGSPYQPVALQARELVLLLVNANVRIAPDRLWETVAGDVRKKLLAAFSFEARELGQDVFLSDVISVIQSVRGVRYVDVDVLGGIPQKKSGAGGRRPLTPREIAEAGRMFLGQQSEGGQLRQRVRVNLPSIENGILRPAQLAYLSPDVNDTLLINQIA